MTAPSKNLAAVECLHAVADHLKTLAAKTTVIEETVFSGKFSANMSDEDMTNLQLIDYIQQALVDASVLLNNLAAESDAGFETKDLPHALNRGLRLEVTRNLIPASDEQNVKNQVQAKHGFVDLF